MYNSHPTCRVFLKAAWKAESLGMPTSGLASLAAGSDFVSPQSQCASTAFNDSAFRYGLASSEISSEL